MKANLRIALAVIGISVSSVVLAEAETTWLDPVTKEKCVQEIGVSPQGQYSDFFNVNLHNSCEATFKVHYSYPGYNGLTFISGKSDGSFGVRKGNEGQYDWVFEK